MGLPELKAWTLPEFFAWQEKQDVRYELVNGFPLRMMAGAKNVHDKIVVNVLGELRNQLRGSGCRPFTGDGSIETLPGQIRRPDIGVDCGRPDQEGYKADIPKVIIEVLSPSTRDFDTFAKLAEYKNVASLKRLLFIDPNLPEITSWSRDEAGKWAETVFQGLESTIDMPEIGAKLRLAEAYEDVTFVPNPRLAFRQIL